ncbi:MAG: phage tail protein [Rhodobacteraceae bacterium]|nr:phage tail protein [Paracoccaceae bacterium]
MIATVLMGLGAFRFGVTGGSYQSLRRTAEYRWASQDRLGRDPALQFTGPGNEEITLEGTIHPHFRGGLRQIEFMRQAARTGEPMMLVDGLGFVFRRWAIMSVEETRTVLMADGAPRQIDFRISLRAYGEDRA